jgi:hypothetical protein
LRTCLASIRYRVQALVFKKKPKKVIFKKTPKGYIKTTEKDKKRYEKHGLRKHVRPVI